MPLSRVRRVRWMLGVGAAVCVVATADAQAVQRPTGLAYDSVGNLYIADAARHQVFEATIGGSLVVVAGSGVQGFAGDGGAATTASLDEPHGLAIGSDGTLYIADTGNNIVRAVTKGTIRTVAGNGRAGLSGDGGASVAAQLNRPMGVALDASGGLLIPDSGNHCVRRVAGGVITRFAGDGVQGSLGDGAGATAAELDEPVGVAVATDGSVYIADRGAHRIRRVGTDGRIMTFAGVGVAGFSGDGGPAAAAMLRAPEGVAVTPTGVIIVDTGNRRLRQVDAAGVITTLSGSGVQGLSAEGIAIPAAMWSRPIAAALSPTGAAAVGDSAGAVWVLSGAGTLVSPAALTTKHMTTLTASVAGSVYGAVVLSAKVAGFGIPGGAVTITENGAAVANAGLVAGTATVSLPTLTAGAHMLAITYSGDGINPAVNDQLNVSIAQATVTASADSAQTAYGLPVPTLSGTATGVLPADSASVAVSYGSSAGVLSPPGVYPITAVLTGSRAQNYVLMMAVNLGALTVTKATPTMRLMSGGIAYVGVPVLVTATVAAPGQGTAGGTVSFTGSGAQSIQGLQQGTATTALTFAASGNTAVTAQYGGDADFTPASGTLNVNVQALPDFSLAAAGSSSQTVIGGQTAVFAINVSSGTSVFTSPVVMSVSGLPRGATASFSPTQTVPGTGGATVTLSVTTVPLTGRVVSPIAVMAAMLVPMLALRRRRRLCAVFMLLLVASGCGDRTSGSVSGVAAQSSTLVVTGTSTNVAGQVVVHSTQVTLIVQ